MKESSISMNMGMKHLSKLRALFIIQEFVILLPHYDPWLCVLKSDLPFFFLRDKSINISSLAIVID